MYTLERQTTEGKLLQSGTEPFSSQCGAITTEADRLVNGRALFVSHTCSRVNGHGQWLRKFAKDT